MPRDEEESSVDIEDEAEVTKRQRGWVKPQQKLPWGFNLSMPVDSSSSSPLLHSSQLELLFH